MFQVELTADHAALAVMCLIVACFIAGGWIKGRQKHQAEAQAKAEYVDEAADTIDEDAGGWGRDEL